MSERRDEALIKAVAGGEGAALGPLLERYWHRAYRLALRWTGGDATLAEDVAQEAFVAVLDAAARFDSARALVRGLRKERVLAKGFTLSDTWVAAKGDDRLTVTLVRDRPDRGPSPTGTIRGRVVDDQGKPVAGVRLSANGRSWDRSTHEGTFVVRAPVGAVRLRVQRADRCTNDLALDIVENEIHEVDITLRVGVRLAGRVEGASQGLGLLIDRDPRHAHLPQRRIELRPNGRLDLGRLAPGEWTLRVVDPLGAVRGSLTVALSTVSRTEEPSPG